MDADPEPWRASSANRAATMEGEPLASWWAAPSRPVGSTGEAPATGDGLTPGGYRPSREDASIMGKVAATGEGHIMVEAPASMQPH